MLYRLRMSEPVRLWLYSILGPGVALLVGYGILSADEAVLWLAVGAAVCGVAGTETARASVYSPATVKLAQRLTQGR